MAHLGNLIKERRETGVLAKKDLINKALAAKDRSFPLHPAILFKILSTKGCISSLLSFEKCRGTPKYLI